LQSARESNTQVLALTFSKIQVYVFPQLGNHCTVARSFEEDCRKKVPI
jgi:hypothetical protein